MIDNQLNDTETPEATLFKPFSPSSLYTENENRKSATRYNVIQTIITILKEDIPIHVKGGTALQHCNFRVRAMEEQHPKFYDTSFYRSVHSFVVNFIDAFKTGRVGEVDVPSSEIERRFLYRELLDELEDFILDC